LPVVRTSSCRSASNGADLRWSPQTALLVANATIARANYVRNDLQDGRLYDVNAGIERAISARLGGSIGVGLTRQTARDPGYANVAGGITTQLYRDAGRITFFGAATVRRLEGDARLFLFQERRRNGSAG
jgi:hypothetical protein